jgi:hypothetical protein
VYLSLFFCSYFVVLCFLCFVVVLFFIVVLRIFIFVCTSVGLLPPGESPIAVSSNYKNSSSFTGFTIHLRVLASLFLMFRDHTQSHNTVGRTPLDE